jgi:transcription antitermination protein NusB
MTARRKARECALQMLFQWELNKEDPVRVEAGFWRAARGDRATRELANRLFEGAASDIPASDELLARHARRWRVDRMAAIDRAILRLAIYELRAGTAPAKVAINEALELAKKFSTPEAGPFINGILDAVLKAHAAKSSRVEP